MSVLWWNERDTSAMTSKRREKNNHGNAEKEINVRKTHKHIKTSAEFQMNEWMNDEFGADICMPYRDSLTHNKKPCWLRALIHSDSTAFIVRARVCFIFDFYLFNFVMKICCSCTVYTFPHTSYPSAMKYITHYIYTNTHIYIFSFAYRLYHPTKKRTK